MERPMPPGAVVHHVNDIKTDNRHSNLVVLQSHQEHLEMHYRRTVLRAGGNPWTQRLCAGCGLQETSAFYRRSYADGPHKVRSWCKHCRAKSQAA